MFQNYRQPILSLQYNMCRPAEEQSMKSNWHFCEIQWWECLQKQQWWWQCCLQPQARRVDRCRRPASSHPIPSTRLNRFPIAARRVSGCWCWRPLAAPSSPRPPSRRPKHQKHESQHKSPICLHARLLGWTECGERGLARGDRPRGNCESPGAAHVHIQPPPRTKVVLNLGPGRTYFGAHTLDKCLIRSQDFSQTSIKLVGMFRSSADKTAGLFEKGGGAEEGGAVPVAL